LLSVSLLGALVASTDDAASMLQAAVVLVEASDLDVHIPESTVAVSEAVSELDPENATKVALLEKTLQQLRFELAAESELQRATLSPPYIFKMNSTDCFSEQDHATIEALLAKLETKGVREFSAAEAARVRRLLTKLTAQLHGSTKVGHFINLAFQQCFQGPIPFMNRMLHMWHKAPVFMNYTVGARVEEGRCPTEYEHPFPKAWEKECFPLADVLISKHVWDGSHEGAHHMSSPLKEYLESHTGPESSAAMAQSCPEHALSHQ